MSVVRINTRDPFDRLTEAERQILLRVFERRQSTDGVEYVLRSNVPERLTTGRLSRRAWADAADILVKMNAFGRLDLPQPPTSAQWLVWHLRQPDPSEPERWTFDAIAARSDCDLHGSTPDSRKQLAIRAFQAVEDFRQQCDGAGQSWWFTICARSFAPDVKEDQETD